LRAREEAAGTWRGEAQPGARTGAEQEGGGAAEQRSGAGERRREEKGGGKRKGEKKKREERNGKREKEERKEKKWGKERRVPAGFEAAPAAGRPRARDVCTLREEKRGGKIASAPITAGGHAWATGHRAVRNGTAVGWGKWRGLGLEFGGALMTNRFSIEIL
jgi:hypothetical protein